MTTNNLTEQWKKGELKEGEYYVKLESGKIDIYFMVYDDDDCDEIVEIIAPVPSYNEWQSLDELVDSMQDTNKALAHRLNICKELLRECRGCFDYLGVDDVMINKIDEALK